MANTTWEAATVTAVTLSGGNLVATSTGTTSNNQGAHAPFADGQTTGKFYFEVTLTTYTGGAGVGVGIGTTAATYSGLSVFATGGDMCFAVGHTGTGTIFVNGGNVGYSIGARTSGDVIGLAVDLINRRIWFRLSPSGLWNGAAGHDPTIGNGTAGGNPIPAGAMVPFVTYGSSFTGAAGVAGNVWTANFGDSAFSGAVPSGYTAGWPGVASGATAQARAAILA